MLVYATDHEPLRRRARRAAAARRRAAPTTEARGVLRGRRRADPRRAVRRRELRREGRLGAQPDGVRRRPRGVGRCAAARPLPPRPGADRRRASTPLRRARPGDRGRASAPSSRSRPPPRAPSSRSWPGGGEPPDLARGAERHHGPRPRAPRRRRGGGQPAMRRSPRRCEAAAAGRGAHAPARSRTSATTRPTRIVVLDVDDEPPGEPPAGGLERARRHPPAVPKVASHVTDWIVLPCTIAHLRTKLHAAVLRRACRWTAAPVPAGRGAPPRRAARARHPRHAPRGPVRPVHRAGAPGHRHPDRPRHARRRRPAVVQVARSGSTSARAPATSRCAPTPSSATTCSSVPDTLEDDRFADNPAVTGPARIRFYAGVPLVLADGSRVGTLCVGDHRPRLLDEHQLDELRRLAALVGRRSSSRPIALNVRCAAMEDRSPHEVLELVGAEEVEFVDLRFCDLPGVMQHVSIPANVLDEGQFEDGHAFDGSSVRGFQQIQESDMVLIAGSEHRVPRPVPPPEDAGDALLRGRPRHRRALLAATRATSPRRRRSTSSPPASPTPRTSGPSPSSSSSTTCASRRRRTARCTGSTPSRGSGTPAPTRARTSATSRAPRRATSRRRRWTTTWTCARTWPPALAPGGHRHRAAPPRGGVRRPGRDRHPLRHAAGDGRQADDVQVRPQERGVAGRQEPHVHAEADLRGQRLGHAHAPVALEGRRAALLRRGRLRGAVATWRAGTSAACCTTPTR